MRILEKCDGTRYAEPVFLHPAPSTAHVVFLGASGAQNSDTLFFMLRWVQCRSHENSIRTCYAELVFLHSDQSTDHIYVRVRPGCEIPMHYFSCPGGPSADPKKMRIGTRYMGLLFLHLVRFVSRRASRVGNIVILFFMLRWP
jgi:hypothetical protein